MITSIKEWKVFKESKIHDSTLYHGSKYNFDKFDLTKVGTGQHSQDFGHGLYFTTDKETATFYANELANFKTPIDKYNDIITKHDKILLGYLKDNRIISAKRRIQELIDEHKNEEEFRDLLNALEETQRYAYVYTVKINNSNYISKEECIKLKHELKLDDKDLNTALLEKGYNGISYPIKSFGSSIPKNEYNVIIIDDSIITITNKKKLNFKGVLKLKI